MDGLIKNLTLKDLEQVLEIQKACYHEDYLESREKFESILQLYPPGCYGIWHEKLVGYLFSHPWRIGECVPLGTPIKKLPENADCLYLHDIAILPEFRGKGAGKALFSKVLDAAQRFKAIELVAVQRSENFWKKLGFKEAKDIMYGGRKAKLMLLQ